MFAVLGDIEIEVLHCAGLDLRAGAAFAEHALIGRRPMLQWTGDALEERRVELMFHDTFADPLLSANRLRQALRDHRVLAFVLGDGTHLGWFVMTDFQEVPNHTTMLGRARAVQVSVTLREYAGDPAQPLERPALQTEPLEAVSAGQVPPSIGTLAGALRDAASYAAQVMGYLGNAVDLVEFARRVAIDPLAALSLIPGISQALTNLGLPVSGLIDVLTGPGSVLDGVGAMLGISEDLLDMLEGITPLLKSGLDVSTVADRLGTISRQLMGADTTWRAEAAPTGAGWAAQSVSRRGT